jgi:hypothetical protein
VTSTTPPPVSSCVSDGQIAIQRRTADPKVFGDVLAGVPVGLHPLCSGDVLGIRDPSRPPELRAVGAGCLALEGGPLSPTLLALAKQVSYLNIWDPHEPVTRLRSGPGRRVRYPSVTGESEFPQI